jgi:hypothetical protein
MRNKTREEILELLPVGEEVDIATSEYSIDPIESTGWNPIMRVHHQTLMGMAKRGMIDATFFWRGATVKRIK